MAGGEREETLADVREWWTSANAALGELLATMRLLALGGRAGEHQVGPLIGAVDGTIGDAHGWLAAHPCPLEWIGIELSEQLTFCGRSLDRIRERQVAGVDHLRLRRELSRLADEFVVAVACVADELAEY
jgi:hypothetical protein